MKKYKVDVLFFLGVIMMGVGYLLIRGSSPLWGVGIGFVGALVFAWAIYLMIADGRPQPPQLPPHG